MPVEQRVQASDDFDCVASGARSISAREVVVVIDVARLGLYRRSKPLLPMLAQRAAPWWGEGQIHVDFGQRQRRDRHSRRRAPYQAWSRRRRGVVGRRRTWRFTFEEEQESIITKLGHLATALGVAALVGLTTPVHAATQVRGAASDEQRALDEVIRAQIDLKHGHRRAARAETLLLNAQQSGTYSDPKSLATLEQAHDALLKGDSQNAGLALRAAENNLKTP